MKFEKLLSDKKIEKVEKTEVDLTSVEKDLKFAQKGMETENYDRVMAVAYEAVLRAGNKLLNFYGYRTIGKEHHKHTFEFLKVVDVDEALVDYFDNIRKKRNNFIYRDVSSTSKEEAEEILKKAESFVHKIKTFVHKIRTGNKKEEKRKNENKRN